MKTKISKGNIAEHIWLRRGIALVVCFGLIVLFPQSANAYYGDIELSGGNTFTAGSLDFSLTNSNINEYIGLTEKISWKSVLTNSGTLPFKYITSIEEIGGNHDFCDALNLEVERNGVEEHDGDLLSLNVSESAILGTWDFEIQMPLTASNISHGQTCRVDVVFEGWQDNFPSYPNGFSDEERIQIDLKSRMVVLNEFLPRPDGIAYGFDFGNDSSDMPQGEWVELYNNSDFAEDLTDWYIWDASGFAANKIGITASNTIPATTTIGAKDWLVVFMNKAVLNNTGDSVKLFDNNDNLIDSTSYSDADYCEIEPTPGDENSTTTTGDCGGVPPNKSYARIPDGIGDWVDPIPTPGGKNALFQEPGYSVFSGFSSESEPEKDSPASTDFPTTPSESPPEPAAPEDDTNGAGGEQDEIIVEDSNPEEETKEISTEEEFYECIEEVNECIEEENAPVSTDSPTVPSEFSSGPVEEGAGEDDVLEEEVIEEPFFIEGGPASGGDSAEEKEEQDSPVDGEEAPSIEELEEEAGSTTVIEEQDPPSSQATAGEEEPFDSAQGEEQEDLVVRGESLVVKEDEETPSDSAQDEEPEKTL